MKASATSFYYLDASERSPSPRVKALEELLLVALALNRGSSAEELADILFETLAPTVPCDRIGLALLTSEGVLTLQHVRSRFPLIWEKGSSAPVAGSSLEPILNERKIRLINDLPAYAKAHPHSPSASKMVAEGMRSSLTLPLSTAQGPPLGVLFFSSVRRSAYAPRHVDFLRTLAAAIGVALERAALLASLQRANDELQTLDQLKTNFLSNLSHELRTPLSLVLGNAYALEDGDVGAPSAAQRPLLAEIIRGADRLNTLLQDLFDYTALEGGRLALDQIPLDLGALVAEVASDHRERLESAGLRLEVVGPAEPLFVLGNAPLLARAIAALLDNARKFTPAPGTVTLEVGRQAEQGWVEVRDTGIGVPAELHSRLFGKFFQADSSATRTTGGAGLGLPLVRAITLAHGGHVWFDSRPGEGSRFRLLLPAS